MSTRTASLRAGAPPALALPTRQRRPGFVALATALVVGFAALGGYLYSQAGAKTPVVMVAADVPAGHVIKREDLSTVAVAGGVTAIAGDHLDSVVGQVAAVHLLPNMLLQRSMFSAGSGLPPSQAQVGVAVKGGQLPADGLNPGDVVEVIQVPGAGAARGDQPQVLVAKAVVFASRDDPSQSGGALLTLVVPLTQVTSVAAANGAGQIALARVGVQ